MTDVQRIYDDAGEQIAKLTALRTALEPLLKARTTPRTEPRAARLEKPATAAAPATATPHADRANAGNRAAADQRRSVMLIVLSRSPASLSFSEIRAALAPTLAAQHLAGQPAIDAVSNAVYQLKTKGLVTRVSGNWALTEEGREEAARLKLKPRAEG